MVDYRLVMLGAVVPLVDVVVGPTPLHTLAGAVLVLAIVMGATTGRRLVRRRLLGVPIGIFIHLVLDATWSDARLFWWPAFGFRFDGSGVPELGRSWILHLVLELGALVVGWWGWRRYRLDDQTNRQLLVRQGHLDRATLV